jgi:hypothetical protein
MKLLATSAGAMWLVEASCRRSLIHGPSVLDGLGRVDGPSNHHIHLPLSVHAARGTSAIKLPFLTQGATAPGSGPNGSGLAQPV